MKSLSFIAAVLLLMSITMQVRANDKLAEFEQLIASHHGKVIYVDFWASWCVPCRKSFPWMNQMQASYAQDGFTVLSVNLDAQMSLAEEFLQQVPAKFPIFYDAKGKIAKAFKLKGMPSSFIIDRQGKVVSSHVGFTEAKQQKYQAEILALLERVDL